MKIPFTRDGKLDYTYDTKDGILVSVRMGYKYGLKGPKNLSQPNTQF